MKKYILILSIAVIAVLNFTLVKSKTSEVTLKSITELAQANADSEHPDIPICSSRVNAGSFRTYGPEYCKVCGYLGQWVIYWDKFTNTNEYYTWDGTQYVYQKYVYNGEADTEHWFYCYRPGTNGAHNILQWKRNPAIVYYNDCHY